MNDSLKIALVQSRLPYTDRRALSEAWFSALHLASDGASARPAPERRGALARTSLASARRAATGGSAPSIGMPRHVEQANRTRLRAVEPEPQTRARAAGRSATVRRAKPPSRTARPNCASLTIAVDAARVQLLLRRDGGTLHVIALCPPNVVETVRRALAQANAHLRARGEFVSSSVRTIAEAEVGA